MIQGRVVEPTPLRILLVRHGETDWNSSGRFQGRSDVPLNELGLAQAEALGLALRPERLSGIYSSPLRRALHTARIIQMHHPGLSLQVEPDLVEMDLGIFDGMQGALWVASHPDFLRVWREKPATLRMPGGETLQEVQSRALKGLMGIAARHRPGETVLVCSHNFVILSILCHAMGLPLDRFRKIAQANGSMNVLRYGSGELWAEKVDDRSHLPPAPGEFGKSRP